MPFGGVGGSGYGAYHGQFGFDGCSHLKPVLEKGTLNFFPLSARYPPYDVNKQALLKFMMSHSFIGQNKLLAGLAMVIILVLALAFWPRGG
jgi:aldehyde dehydrogenase (NAD+)